MNTEEECMRKIIMPIVILAILFLLVNELCIALDRNNDWRTEIEQSLWKNGYNTAKKIPPITLS